MVESQPGCSSDPVAKDNQQCIPIALEDMITDLSCGDGDEEMERELVAGMQTWLVQGGNANARLSPYADDVDANTMPTVLQKMCHDAHCMPPMAVQLLIAHGASVNVRGDERSPLLSAMRSAIVLAKAGVEAPVAFSIVEMLLNAGARDSHAIREVEPVVHLSESVANMLACNVFEMRTA